MIKISVLTCTYNAADTIERTLRSVESQAYEAVEHIIIDGKSKDNTIDLARNYEARNASLGNGHTVKVVSEPDKGLYDAMNKGLHLATGHYLVYLNAGDKFHDTTVLTSIAKAAEGHEKLPGVIYADTDLVDNEGQFVRHRRLKPAEKMTWRSFINGMIICHQSFYALTSIAQRTPYNILYRYSADVDWCIRIMKTAAQEGRKLQNAHIIATDYLAEGMTTANHKASLRERFRVMCHHYGTVRTVLQHLWFVARAVLKK